MMTTNLVQIISKFEREKIKSELEKKRKELALKHKKKLKELNAKGIFDPKINEIRVESMLHTSIASINLKKLYRDSFIEKHFPKKKKPVKRKKLTTLEELDQTLRLDYMSPRPASTQPSARYLEQLDPSDEAVKRINLGNMDKLIDKIEQQRSKTTTPPKKKRILFKDNPYVEYSLSEVLEKHAEEHNNFDKTDIIEKQSARGKIRAKLRLVDEMPSLVSIAGEIVDKNRDREYVYDKDLLNHFGGRIEELEKHLRDEYNDYFETELDRQIHNLSHIKSSPEDKSLPEIVTESARKRPKSSLFSSPQDKKVDIELQLKTEEQCNILEDVIVYLCQSYSKIENFRLPPEDIINQKNVLLQCLRNMVFWCSKRAARSWTKGAEILFKYNLSEMTPKFRDVFNSHNAEHLKLLARHYVMLHLKNDELLEAVIQQFRENVKRKVHEKYIAEIEDKAISKEKVSNWRLEALHALLPGMESSQKKIEQLEKDLDANDTKNLKKFALQNLPHMVHGDNLNRKAIDMNKKILYVINQYMNISDPALQQQFKEFVQKAKKEFKTIKPRKKKQEIKQQIQEPPKKDDIYGDDSEFSRLLLHLKGDQWEKEFAQMDMITPRPGDAQKRFAKFLKQREQRLKQMQSYLRGRKSSSVEAKNEKSAAEEPSTKNLEEVKTEPLNQEGSKVKKRETVFRVIPVKQPEPKKERSGKKESSVPDTETKHDVQDKHEKDINANERSTPRSEKVREHKPQITPTIKKSIVKEKPIIEVQSKSLKDLKYKFRSFELKWKPEENQEKSPKTKPETSTESVYVDKKNNLSINLRGKNMLIQIAPRKSPKTEKESPKDHKYETAFDILQKLDQVWDALLVPYQEKINLYNKYSDNPYRYNSKLINKVFKIWKAAAEAVLTREHTLQELKHFEEEASDPKRLFGSSGAQRLKEERTRATLYSTLCKHANQCERLAKKLNRETGEVLTYEGQNYLEKMDNDYNNLIRALEEKRLLQAEYNYAAFISSSPLPPKSGKRRTRHFLLETVEPQDAKVIKVQENK